MSDNAVPLHIALHVPKCAGRTVEHHLSTHLKEKFWSPDKRTRQLPLELFGRKYCNDLPADETLISAISGHFIGRSVIELFPDRKIYRSILLRRPEDYFLSYYNFRMMRYRTQGLGNYPFRTFVRALPVDPITYFILQSWFELPWIKIVSMTAAEKIRLIDAELATFDFTGDIADADKLIAWMSPDLGIPGIAERKNTAQQWKDTTGWDPLTLADLSASERSLVIKRTHCDRYFWSKWGLKSDAVLEPRAGRKFIAGEMRRPMLNIKKRLLRRRLKTNPNR